MQIIAGILLFHLISPSFCLDEDYVDFTDMGSYDHGFQVNKLRVRTDPLIIGDVAGTQGPHGTSIPLQGINVENASRPMKYLQRVVKSLLRQMNVRSHVFGPGEAITIDLQAEIKYDDYLILDKFSNALELDEPNKQLGKIDDILSNLIHAVEHTESRIHYFEFFVNLPIFHSLKFWLVLMTMSVIGFLLVMLSLRTVYASNNAVMLFYSFLIIYILSCIWTFSYMYEDARATNHAKLMQTQSPPKDCEYENLGFKESISYFFRVHLFGLKDRCEQYYSTTMTDPFWSVNPLEAMSKSFSVLVFAPFGYVGDKLGLFFGGIVKGIPFWLQPLLLILVFGFLFLSIFGYRIVCPFFTIEPARPYHLEHNRGAIEISKYPVNSITDRVKNELVERPERKIMKSVKDASTDMDDFESYLNGSSNEERTESDSRTVWYIVIMNYVLVLWDLFREVLDYYLRQVPEGDEFYNPEDEPEEILNENAINDQEDVLLHIPVPENNEVVREDFDHLNDNNEVEEDYDRNDDVVIPRRRFRRSISQELLDVKDLLVEDEDNEETERGKSESGDE